MLKVIQKKLHSEEGASVIFALLFFLVAAMVSAVIVASAVSGLRRLHDDTEYEQNVLAISSAIMLVEQQMTAESTKSEALNYITVTQTERSDSSAVTTTVEAGTTGAFAGELKAAVNYFYPSSGASAAAAAGKKFDSSKNGCSMVIRLDDELPEVNVDYVMYPLSEDTSDNTSFQIVMTFSIEGEKETETVTFKAYSSSKVSTREEKTGWGPTRKTVKITDTITTYTWDAYHLAGQD